jgi:hypothetical protein
LISSFNLRVVVFQDDYMEIGITLKKIFREKIIRKSALIGSIGLFLAGCQMSSEHPNIFEDPTCQAPCWQNITPGITTKSEATEILNNYPGTSQLVVISNTHDTGFDDIFNFDLNYSLGSLYILDDKVFMLDFEYTQNLTLQKAIVLFGTPEKILVTHDGEYTDVSLFAPRIGIAFGYRKFQGIVSEISAKDEIDHVLFFDPIQYQRLLSTRFISYYEMTLGQVLENMQPWAGYGSADRYVPTPMTSASLLPLLLTITDMPAGWISYDPFPAKCGMFEEFCYSVQFDAQVEGESHAGETIYFYDYEEESVRLYQQPLLGFAFGNSPPGWSPANGKADESYLGCYQYELPDYPLCTYVARYGRYLVKFSTWMVPGKMSLADLENVVNIIDQKMPSYR